MNAVAFQVHSPFGGVSPFVPQIVPTAPTLAKVIDECIAAKIRANRRPLYVKVLRIYLTAFAAGREDMAITSITGTMIEQWFDRRREALTTRKGGMSRISTLLSFARRRSYVSINPVENMEPVTIDHRPPRILTPMEARRLLLFTRRKMPWRLTHIVLGLYAGIRPAELQRLFWRDIDMEKGIVRIDAAASKTRQRRIVPLEAKALKWLRVCPQNEKPIGPRKYKWIAKIEREIGIVWHRDILRHTCASYWLAKHEDVGKVARWLGNSPTILLKHYSELVGADDCRRYWRTFRPALRLSAPRRVERPTSIPQSLPIFQRCELAIGHNAGRVPLRECAELAGVSHEQIRKVDHIMHHADEFTLRRARAGQDSIHQAWLDSQPEGRP